MTQSKRPDIVEDDMLLYLDNLRVLGVTNMFGAAQFLERDYKLTKNEALKVLNYWMRTFEEEDR